MDDINRAYTKHHITSGHPFFQDGSQVLSIFFLFILMLMYAALIPYGLAANEVVCALRSAATRLVYSAAFAIMCTRSIMLATADTDGLPGKG